MTIDPEDEVRSIMAAHPRDVLDIHLRTNVVVFDIDGEEDYEELLARLGLAPPPSPEPEPTPAADESV